MKINKYNITFDSELELNFFEYLKENGVEFKYNNEINKPFNINLGRRKTYTPDFIVYDNNKKVIHVIETKGYAKWSANEDNNICDFLKNKVETDKDYIFNFLKENNAYKEGYNVNYERIKRLKSIGFVPYNYKNPNTIANKRKEKIIVLENELKELKKELKEKEKLINIMKKALNGEKISKKEKEKLEFL